MGSEISPSQLWEKNREVVSCDIDGPALKALQKTLSQPGLEYLQDRLTLLEGDFQKTHSQNLGSYDLILVNPPRSGLKNFLDPLFTFPKKPKWLLYMSCFPETLWEDGQRLENLGYTMDHLTLVDQFPGTSHIEVLTLWSLK